MCEQLTSKEYLLGLIRTHLQLSNEPILSSVHENKEMSERALFGVQTFQALVDFNCQTLRGRYGSANYDFQIPEDDDDENHWWNLEDLRFLQLLAINALQILTFDCQEGSLETEVALNVHSSLSGTCDIETYRKIQTKMDRRGFQCCRVVYNTDSLIKSEDVMVLGRNTYPVFINEQADRFVQFKASSSHFEVSILDFASGQRDGDKIIHNFYGNVLRGTTDFIILDTILNRRIHVKDGLFTQLLGIVLDHECCR